MSRSVKKDIISTETFQLWERQAAADEDNCAYWHDYMHMMAIFQAALQRMPLTMEACADIDIEDLLESELEHLANLVLVIFPGGIMELEHYVTTTEEPE